MKIYGFRSTKNQNKEKLPQNVRSEFVSCGLREWLSHTRYALCCPREFDYGYLNEECALNFTSETMKKIITIDLF